MTKIYELFKERRMERLMMPLALISTLFMVSSCSLGAKDELFDKLENR